MGKKREIIEKFKDLKISFQDLQSDKHLLEDWVAGYEDVFSKDPGKVISYGVTTRLGTESEGVIVPFNFNNKGFDAQKVLEKVNDGFKIPDFMKLSGGIEEVFFRADFELCKNDNKDINKIIITKIEFEGNNPYTLSPYNSEKVDEDTLKEKLNRFLSIGYGVSEDTNNVTFLHENIRFLCPEKNNIVYVWIRGEDPDISSRFEVNYLSYIFAISDDSQKLDAFRTGKKASILEFLNLLKSRLILEYGIKLKKEATKAAKAAIMSRNLSHNLGSHVMSYLKQSLKSVANIEKSGALEELSKKGKELPYKEGTALKPEMPYLVGTGKFISYLQERQDYIATVSTDYIPYPSVVNYKDGIFDELNPDYKYQRHKNFQDWRGHQPTNILLENIARSEGLSRQNTVQQEGNNILIRYRNFDGLNIYEAKEDYNKLRHYNFSLPGGIMGRQAVFSIVENVIRNAAKHGFRKAGEDLIVTFDILEPLDSNSFNGFDMEFCERYKKERSHDIDELYIITLTTNDKTDDDIKIIKDAIYESLDEGGNLNKSNKGIKEMVISAAWLRNIRIEELDEDKRKQIAPILWVRSEKGNLQYVFCLPKVKEVALIVNEQSPLLEKKNDVDWKYNGWYIYTLNEYKKLNSKNFNFVILEKKLAANKEEVRKCSTNRFFVEATETNLSQHEIKFSIDVLEKSMCTKDELNKTLIDLYAQLSGYENDFHIAVSDNSYIFDISSNHVVDIQSSPSKESSLCEYNYIYRKHNDTKSEFDKFVKIYTSGSEWRNLEFIEGISGGNSTDRLIRHTVLDDLWAFKHFHAMKTKVAIFDERLFSYITGIDMSILQSANMNWGKILEDKKDDEARAFVKEFDNSHQQIISPNRELREAFREYTMEDVLEFVKINYSNYIDLPVTDVSSIVYHKKKIDLFTITETNGGVLIWGISFMNQNTAGVYGQVEVVGKIIFEKNNDMICPVVKRYDEDEATYFDYISIHQGLLDKVYKAIPKEAKEVKEAGEAKDAKKSEEAKEKLISSLKLGVTKSIYKKFVNPQEISDDYLQGMIIHSGRSKPNKENMPQHQPFLQYAAIENAFFDCKYTLVEVLDFACFDNN